MVVGPEEFSELSLREQNEIAFQDFAGLSHRTATLVNIALNPFDGSASGAAPGESSSVSTRTTRAGCLAALSSRASITHCTDPKAVLI